MTVTLHLSNREARRFLLARQGLWPPRALTGKEGVAAVFSLLACIQFDPLNVVGRNPDLVLQSRISDYRPQWLYEKAYDERQLFDYWDKMMAYIPMRDWPSFEIQRKRWQARHAKRSTEMGEHVGTVRDVIRERGPMCSLDFKPKHGVDWKTEWRWGPKRAAKAILEMLADTGQLMVSHRRSARRYYDLAERVVPSEIAEQPRLTDEKTYIRWRVARRCQGIGLLGPALGGEAWAGVGNAQQRTEAIKNLVQAGEMTPVQIEDDGRTYHMLSSDEVYLAQAHAPEPDPMVAFVAPLDNLLWSRSLIERIFDFKYVWEVYKPAAQREYGYYVLPVLYGDRFVARFDSKLARDTATLSILSWHWETGESLTDDLVGALRSAFGSFAAYLGAERVAAANGVNREIADLVV